MINNRIRLQDFCVRLKKFVDEPKYEPIPEDSHPFVTDFILEELLLKDNFHYKQSDPQRFIKLYRYLYRDEGNDTPVDIGLNQVATAFILNHVHIYKGPVARLIVDETEFYVKEDKAIYPQDLLSFNERTDEDLLNIAHNFLDDCAFLQSLTQHWKKVIVTFLNENHRNLQKVAQNKG